MTMTTLKTIKPRGRKLERMIDDVEKAEHAELRAANTALQAAESKRNLTIAECDSIVDGLLRLLQSPNPDHPAELIALANAAIEYVTAIDEAHESTTDNIDELVYARDDWRMIR